MEMFLWRFFKGDFQWRVFEWRVFEWRVFEWRVFEWINPLYILLLFVCLFGGEIWGWSFLDLGLEFFNGNVFVEIF